jgi:hypothetical protein
MVYVLLFDRKAEKKNRTEGKREDVIFIKE